MEKTKPIFTIGLPSMETNKQIIDLQKRFDVEFKGYHVLVYCHFGDEIKFAAFYEKDFNKVKYE